MAVRHILLFGSIINYVAFIQTNEVKASTPPYCFHDSEFKEMQIRNGESAELEFKRDTKSPIDDSQLMYFKIDCDKQEQIANIQNEKDHILMEKYNSKGELKINEDKIVYTLTKTEMSDTGIYVLRQNMFHVQIYLEVVEKASEIRNKNEELIYGIGAIGCITVVLIVIIIVGVIIHLKRRSRPKNLHANTQYSQVNTAVQGQENAHSIIAVDGPVHRRNVPTTEAD